MIASSSLAWGTAIGLALGVAYTASPLTVWFVIVMIGLFVWAGRGLSNRERGCVWGILAVAVMVRVLAIAVLFLTNNRYLPVSFFWDGDGMFLKMRATVIRNVWLGIPNNPHDLFLAFQRGYGWTTYLYVIAYLQYLTGPAPYGVHLFNVALFVAAAVLLYRLVRSAYGRTPALLGLVLLLFLPSLISWSVSALKESLFVFLCALGLAAAVAIVRAKRIAERAFWIALLAGTLAANSEVRVGALLIMMMGIVAGFVGTMLVRRAGLVLLVLALSPFVAFRLWDSLGVQAHADLQERIMSQLKTSAVIHAGNVRTPGNHYKLLDQRLYTGNAIATMTPAEGLRFAVRALLSIVFVPLPSQVRSTSEILFLAQQVVWYLLVVFACVGLIAGIRRDALVTCMLAGISATGGAVIAFNSGNIGTMVRLRDTVVPFVLWLSALGIAATVSTIMSGGRSHISRRSAPCL